MNLHVARLIKNIGTLSLSVFLFQGCGKSSDSSSSDLSSSLSGLQSIPSVSQMVKANSASSSAASAIKRNSFFNSVGLQAVSGTPETLLNISNSSTLVNNLFFDGLITTINNNQTATQAQATAFWEGQGKCWLSQSVAESIARMMQNGTTLCYMQKVPSNADAFTVVSGSVPEPSKLFNQAEADKLVKVQISGNNDDDHGGGNQNIFLKVIGSNTVTSDVYKVVEYECTGSTVTNREEFTVNKKTGTYTSSGTHNGNYGSGTSTLSAKLKVGSDGTITFDTGADRTATVLFSGNFGTFKGDLTVTSENLMRAKRYNSFTYQNQSNSDKNYAVTKFSGDSLRTLRFLEGGSKGLSSWGNNGSHTYSVNTEYQDTHYATVTSGNYTTEINAFDFTTDSFFTTNLSASTPTFSESCSATPDVVISINMATSSMQTIQSQCEGERLSNYNMCNSSSMQSAQQYIFSSQNYH